MKKTLTVYGLFVLLVFFVSCQKDTSFNRSSMNINTGPEALNVPTSPPPVTECGTPVFKDLIDMGGVGDRGDVYITNDNSNITLTVTGAVGTFVKRVIVVFGSHDHVYNAITQTLIWTPCDGPQTPDYTKVSAPGLNTDTVQIPNSAFQADNCTWIALYVTTTDGNFDWCTFPSPYDEIIPNISIWKVFFKYCKQTCGPPPPSCGQLRTQTPGGWGAPPEGNNTGAYLHANFAAAFPNGLTVGCTPNFNITLTTAQAITDYLPAGGTPAVLTGNYLNPATKDLKNTLAMQVIALQLSVGFDVYDQNFGQAGIHLGDMIIGSGAFKGWKVSDFLVEANKILGGCSSNYKPQDVSDVLDKINNNYDDGKVDKGFLTCPK